MVGIVLIRLLMTGLALMAPTAAAESMSPETIRKVARLELARSIRAFAAGSLAVSYTHLTLPTTVSV